MQKEQGFSMLELLIVVAVITLIAAIAIPNLRSARQTANAASAVQSLRTITTAQELYKTKYSDYGTLAQLAPEGTLDPQLGAGMKSNYIFTVNVLTPTSPSEPPDQFEATATPLESPAQYTYYFVDHTSVIRFNVGAPATASSPPIPK